MYNEPKTWIAFAIHYGESSCGCSRVTYNHVYDKSGNQYKKFSLYDDAVIAAKAKMLETDADNWNVV